MNIDNLQNIVSDNYNYYMKKFIYSMYVKIRGNCHYYLPPYPSTEFGATKITDNLYIGDIYSIYQKEHLRDNNITHVVSVVMGLTPPYPDEFKYLNVEAIDEIKENLLDKFNETITYIDNAINEGGTVLIHCICGVSRSVTIASAYLMYKNNWTIEQTLKFIKNKRNVANPNPSFIKQLNIFYNNYSKK